MERSDKDYAAILAAPFGAVAVRCDADSLLALDFVPPRTGLKSPVNGIASTVTEQLRRYFDDPDWRFDLPIRPEGTVFRRRVWRQLLDIPSGRVLTYGDLAQRLGTSARAVGGACRHNPIPLVIPCHRVVACDGLGGFAGSTGGTPLYVKRWLLSHEGYLSSGLEFEVTQA